MLPRRHLLGLAALAWAGRAAAQPVARRTGHVIAIGGNEDRSDNSAVLRRFIELSGGPQARIAVLTAASGEPEAVSTNYLTAFQALGVEHCLAVDARSRVDADDPVAAARLLEADGIFLSGGDQRRLMATLGGSGMAQAIRIAFHVRGACIAGTSAGAAALSRHMLAEGSTPTLPEKDAARLASGLGLVPHAIIDQHFSQRRRLGRLLSVLAEQPEALGLGIDENTALVIERGRGIEVVGQGAVTLLDGRRMVSNLQSATSRERLELLGVRLHLLPAGNRYRVTGTEGGRRGIPDSLADALGLLVAIGPLGR